MDKVIKIESMEEINSTMLKTFISFDVKRMLSIKTETQFEDNYDNYRVVISIDTFFEPVCYLNSDNCILIKVSEKSKEKRLKGTTFVHKNRVESLKNIIDNFNEKFGYKEV